MVGVVTLTMAPEASLYPLLSEETVSTKTGETLLFRIDTGDVSYLSPIRHAPASPSATTSPANETKAKIFRLCVVARRLSAMKTCVASVGSGALRASWRS